MVKLGKTRFRCPGHIAVAQPAKYWDQTGFQYQGRFVAQQFHVGQPNWFAACRCLDNAIERQGAGQQRELMQAVDIVQIRRCGRGEVKGRAHATGFGGPTFLIRLARLNRYGARSVLPSGERSEVNVSLLTWQSNLLQFWVVWITDLGRRSG